MNSNTFNSPASIKAELDKYVIGQEMAKRTLAVAAYKHMQVINHKDELAASDINIDKSNVMMIGPSGCGKTYLVQTLSRILDVPYVIIDATEYVQTGFKGSNVEKILSLLIEKANGDISAAEKGIVFIDEIDKKSFKPYYSSGIDHAGMGVQQSLLKIIEDGKAILNNNKTIDTSNILFIVGGAFVGLDKIVKRRTSKVPVKRIGLVTNSMPTTTTDNRSYSEIMSELLPEDICSFGFLQEFVGRFPQICTLDALSEEQLCEILTKPKNCLLDQYNALFMVDGFRLKFQPEALKAVAHKAILNGTGARGLRGIMEKLLLLPMYSAPNFYDTKLATLIITKKMVDVGACPEIKGRRASTKNNS